MSGWPPQPGDWVRITAKVEKVVRGGEELQVELFSKSTQYSELVRADICEPTGRPIRDEPDEGSVALVNAVAHQRLGDGHWYSAGEVGRADGLTWVELNGLGDVEVIHHA